MIALMEKVTLVDVPGSPFLNLAPSTQLKINARPSADKIRLLPSEQPNRVGFLAEREGFEPSIRY